jgi:hypothetical protein
MCVKSKLCYILKRLLSFQRTIQSASSTTDMSSHTVKMQTTESKHVTVEIRKHTTTPALGKIKSYDFFLVHTHSFSKVTFINIIFR